MKLHKYIVFSTIIFILCWMVTTVILVNKVDKINKYQRENQRIIDSTLYENVKFMRKHLNNCAFISKQSIKSINGNQITLKWNYH